VKNFFLTLNPPYAAANDSNSGLINNKKTRDDFTCAGLVCILYQRIELLKSLIDNKKGPKALFCWKFGHG